MKSSLDICSNLKEEWRFRNLSNDASIHFFFFWVRSLSKTITISEEFQDLYAHYEKKRHFCSLLLRYFFIQLREKRRRRTTFEIDDGWTRTSWSSPSRIWNLTPNAGLRAKRSGDLQLWICQISSKNEVIFHLYVRRSKYLMLILCETLRRISWYS